MITLSTFGHMPDGSKVERISLINAHGMQVDVLTLGAIIQRWLLGNEANTDIVLGFDDLEGYLQDSAYIGVVAARYANRIADAQMPLGDAIFTLSANLQGNCLHGGSEGFNRRIWQKIAQRDGDSPSVTLGMMSPDGDQGFPGTLHAKVTYQLDKSGTLRITYEASSDKLTVYNPTQHSYFNLGGHDSGEVSNHTLQVKAQHYTPTDDQGIPTGDIASVAQSVFDLRQAQPLAALRDQPALRATQGLDHNWCIDDYQHPLAKLRTAAIYHDPATQRTLTVRTDMPGMQVYNANFLPGDLKGKQSVTYGGYQALCLETQFYPDSPNQPGFPSATLAPDQPFQSITEYEVSQ